MTILPKMNKRLLTFFALLAISAVCFAGMPSKVVGVWATNDTVFDGEFLQTGFAIYLREDGSAIILGGERTSKNCSQDECHKVSGGRFLATFDDRKQDIHLSGRDMTGATISGRAFVYEDKAQTLTGVTTSFSDKVLYRKFASAPPIAFQAYTEAIAKLEHDIPTGFATYVVHAANMEPTLKRKQIVLADLKIYGDALPTRGDIVAFRSVKHDNNVFIERVVALPGDRLEIREGNLFINNQQFVETYVLPANRQTPYSKKFEPIVLQEGSIFVLGDNRDRSMDSRLLGPISIKDVVGKAFMVKPSEHEGEFVPIR
ncbi:signal peptidase I [Oxalobacteraceae bacterium OM1]|nr:signal peptidase I [Oxalobacteraceae bacterium OM1]